MKILTNQYYIIYERDEKKGYIASVPAIPGCVVYGKTLKEAYKNICSAIKECLEVIYAFHRELPTRSLTNTLVISPRVYCTNSLKK